jgi:hypothetical protein
VDFHRAQQLRQAVEKLALPMLAPSRGRDLMMEYAILPNPFSPSINRLFVCTTESGFRLIKFNRIFQTG